MPGCNCPMCNPRGQDSQKRAEELLLSFLDERQQEQLRKYGQFEVVGSDGQTYLIETGDYSGNVMLMKGGRAMRRYCCYPRFCETVPLADLILGQVLALKTDARRFVQIAR